VTKLYLGIAPLHERHPTLELDGRGMVIQVGDIWKRQLIREFGLPLNALLQLERSPYNDRPGYEVVASYEESSNEARRWNKTIEVDCPEHWDNTSLDALERLGWLIHLK